jgi:hypothetical protein
MRLGHGVVGSLPRIVGPTDAIITGVKVPKGVSNLHLSPIVSHSILHQTIVSTSVTYPHLNEEIFPDAHTFKPERWLEPSAKALDSWLIPFSRGPRMCLGMKYVPFALSSILHLIE